MRAALSAVLLLATAAAGATVMAPSTLAPGGLEPSRTPQFVLISHDDAIKTNTHTMIRQLTDGKTANGCPVTATMFVTRPSTANDCELTLELFSRGFEIAHHTVGHEAQGAMTKEQIAADTAAFFPQIEACGVPKSDVVGWRAPFLETKPEQRQVLHEAGLLYDSSLVENTQGRSMSPSPSQRVWPWTMDNGTAIDCDKFQRRQTCEDSERYPGLWQVPIWQQTALGGPFNLDVYKEEPANIEAALKANFDAAYNGNRAPYAVPFHSTWLEAGDALPQMQRFVDYASAKPDVFFITYRQLIAWMQNPVPADQLTPEALGCGNKGGAPGTLASSASSGSKSSVASPAPAPSPSPAPTEPEAEAEVASESPASPPPAPPAAPEEEQPAATVEEARPAEQQQQQSAAAAGEGGTYTDLAAALEAAGYSFSG